MTEIQQNVVKLTLVHSLLIQYKTRLDILQSFQINNILLYINKRIGHKLFQHITVLSLQ